MHDTEPYTKPHVRDGTHDIEPYVEDGTQQQHKLDPVDRGIKRCT